MRNLLAVDIGKEFKFGNQGVGQIEGYKTLGGFISSLLPNVYVIAGLILLFLTLFGGFGLLSAGGDKEKIAQGSKTITAAVVGFAIIFVSFWLIKLIEVLTGVTIF